jgi:hypothetical protein
LYLTVIAINNCDSSDSFDKLPNNLQDIINDPIKRNKLIIYINPPYAEADNRKGEGRKGIAESNIYNKYKTVMGYTRIELFIQFLTRISGKVSFTAIVSSTVFVV